MTKIIKKCEKNFFIKFLGPDMQKKNRISQKKKFLYRKSVYNSEIYIYAKKNLKKSFYLAAVVVVDNYASIQLR